MLRAAAIVVALSLASSAGVASAQPAYHRKSHDIAKALSGGGAGLSTALVLTSFLATDPHNPYNVPLFYGGIISSIGTPSLGEIYAEQYLTTGMAVRAGGAALAIVGVNLTKSVSCLTTPPDNSCKEISTGGIAVLGLGLLGYIGGVFYDVLDAPDSVDRYNYKQRMKLDITPGPMPSPGGGPMGGGVWLSGRF